MKPIELLKTELDKRLNAKHFREDATRIKFEKDMAAELKKIDEECSPGIIDYQQSIAILDPSKPDNYYEDGKLALWNEPGEPNVKVKYDKNKIATFPFDTVHKALNMSVDEQTEFITSNYTSGERICFRKALENISKIEKWDPDFEDRLPRIIKTEIVDCGKVSGGSAY